MRKLFVPILIAAFAIAASSVAPFFASVAKAAGSATKIATPVSEQRPGIIVNPAQDGVEIDQRAAQIYTSHYGPVDQSKPLDFSTQPKTVPRNYVGGKLYNIQVLKGYSYGQVIGQMTYYTQSVGVSCTYCHNAGNFAYDTATKKIARTMQIMSNGVTHDWIDPVKKDYPKYAVAGAVGCATCHRGQPQMAVKWNVVPVQYLDSTQKSTKQAGYVVNSMYSAARSLGVNCLFCHNSADFVTLQYYPTNQIAHRMWRMLDDINHKYLPANVKAVTCYTCHQGGKWPSVLVKAGLDQTPVQAVAAHPEYQDNPGAHVAAGAQ